MQPSASYLLPGAGSRGTSPNALPLSCKETNLLLGVTWAPSIIILVACMQIVVVLLLDNSDVKVRHSLCGGVSCHSIVHVRDGVYAYLLKELRNCQYAVLAGDWHAHSH